MRTSQIYMKFNYITVTESFTNTFNIYFGFYRLLVPPNPDAVLVPDEVEAVPEPPDHDPPDPVKPRL